jgi:hypothetical protein
MNLTTKSQTSLFPFSIDQYSSIRPTLVIFDDRVPQLEVLQAALLPDRSFLTISATATDALEVITARLAETGATHLAIYALNYL